MAQNGRATAGKRTGNAIGCTGCLGYLLVFFSLIGILIASQRILVQQGAGDASLVLPADMWDSLPKFLLDHITLFSVLGVVLGTVLAYAVARAGTKQFTASYEKAGQSAASEYDLLQAQRLKKFKRSEKWFWLIAIVLLGLSFLSIFFAKTLFVGGAMATSEEADIAFIITLFPVLGGFLGCFVLLVPVFSTLRFMVPGTKVSAEQMIYNTLQPLFQNFFFQRDACIPKEAVDATHLVGVAKNAIGYKGNDYISGVYKGLAFSQSDLSYKMYTYDKGEGTYKLVRDLFYGRWIVTQNRKPINSRVYIYNKTFKSIDKEYLMGQGLQPVSLEDMSFNSVFTIYADDPHDAFYLLTPALIERLKYFAGLHTGEAPAEGIGVYCAGGEIHFAISGVQDAFSLLYASAASETEVKSRILRDISLVTDTIDALVSEGAAQGWKQ